MAPSKMFVAALALVAKSTMAQNEPTREAFDLYKKTYEKFYSGKEDALRFDVYKQNIATINDRNAKGFSYKLGVNAFTDMTVDEFAMNTKGVSPGLPSQWEGVKHLGTHVYSGAALPDSVDWRTKGAVNPVKNQAQCGSCWAFSAIGALEGAWEIATGKLVSLSEQQMVDCATSFGNGGCSGGLMDHAFLYVEQAGLCTEASYPYKAVNSVCAASNCTLGIANGDVTGFKDVTSSDENALMEAVAQQPVSIAIEADRRVFQLYRSGVLNATCGTRLDHGVLLVGYGKDTESSQDYWLVRNSWGAVWGMDGYIKLLRGKSGVGECGIKSAPSYPVVQKKSVVVV